IVLDLHLLTEPLPVTADISQLEQVLMNLAVNARDAMPRGGRLLIETRRVELDMDYVENTPGTTPGDYALIAVSDSGSGMDRATLQRIFEPFYTTKGKDVGTGLGLSTVYGIVKQHGGNIWAYSEPGEGSTFKVYLPLASAEKPAEAPPPDPHAAVDHGSATVLIAEDDPNVRRLTARILSSKGYHVLTSRSVDDAIRIGRSHVGPIDLLLSDVVMPGMTGPELHARLSPDRPEMKVIFMSGYSGEAVSRYGVLNHDTYFIQKPFAARTLLAKVAEALTG
ncbi:MAG TPA: ATP-binding protein, partial [Desulfosarcina sp.]|nr:ATP-binding protein [Desulfosarcina sp.]